MIIVLEIFISILLYILVSVKLTTNNDALKKFEKQMRQLYPIGNKQFYISHGDKYMAFFNRLGKAHMYTYNINGQIVASACGVLRTFSFAGAGIPAPSKAWYICDLKVDPKYRGYWIPFQMGLVNLYHLFKCNKIYAISMNSTAPNRVVELSKKISKWLGIVGVQFKFAGTLNIYKVNYETMIQILPLLCKHKGNGHFISLSGIKDLVVNDKPMKLYHFETCNGDYSVQQSFLLSAKNDAGVLAKPTPRLARLRAHISVGTGIPAPTKLYDKNGEYMFCFHETIQTPLKPYATASIIQSNMDNFDWNLIQTSEI